MRRSPALRSRSFRNLLVIANVSSLAVAAVLLIRMWRSTTERHVTANSPTSSARSITPVDPVDDGQRRKSDETPQRPRSIDTHALKLDRLDAPIVLNIDEMVKDAPGIAFDVPSVTDWPVPKYNSSHHHH